MVRVAAARLASVPTVQTPVALLYVPRLGVARMNVSPAGRRSLTVTFVAVFGPWFVRVSVNVTVSPTFGRGRSTALTRCRSARWRATTAWAVLLAVFGSNTSEAETDATLVAAAGPATVARRIRVVLAPDATVPTVHVPVPES